MLGQAAVGSGGYGPHPLFKKLMRNTKFKNLFINIYADWLNSYFLREVELSHFDAMKDQLDPFIAEFDDRWPNTYPWESGTAEGRSLISTRAGLRREQLRNYYTLGSGRTVILNTDPAKGLIRCNSLLVDENTPGVSPEAPYPWDGSYFKNIPIQLTAVSRDGYRFVGWRVSFSGTPLNLPGSDPANHSQQPVIALSLSASGTKIRGSGVRADSLFGPACLGLRKFGQLAALIHHRRWPVSGDSRSRRRRDTGNCSFQRIHYRTSAGEHPDWGAARLVHAHDGLSVRGSRVFHPPLDQRGGPSEAFLHPRWFGVDVAGELCGGRYKSAGKDL